MKTHSPLSPFRIGAVPEHFNLPWRRRSQLHKQDPDNVEKILYREYSGGTGSMVAALADDEIDIAILLTEGAMVDIAHGGKHRIVKIYVDTPLEWGIHVPAASNLHDIPSIRGQRYAISRKGSGSHIMAAVHAASLGWPVDQLDYVKVRNLAGARLALPAGDAEIFFWEKTMTQPYVVAGEFRRVGEFHSPWPSFVVCASTHIILTQPERLLKLLTQINHLAGELQTGSDSANQIASTYDLTVAASRKWLKQTHWNLNFELPSKSLQTVLSTLQTLEMDVSEEFCLGDFIYRL